MEALIGRLVDGMLHDEGTSEEDIIIYKFGLRQGIITALNMLTIVLIGWLTKELTNLVVFTMTYMLLRPYAGGYHAKTVTGCYIFSMSMIAFIVIILKYATLNSVTMIILLGISMMLLMRFAPVENVRKPLDHTEEAYYKAKLRRILFASALVILVITFITGQLPEMIVLAITASAFMVTLGIAHIRLKKYYAKV